MSKRNLVEEMRELGKLRTAVMMEKCSIKSELVECPKPRRRNLRQCRDLTDGKDGMDLSDIIFGKASPPSYPCSPPTRASNPLIQDARFREQRLQQSPSFGARIEETIRLNKDLEETSNEILNDARITLGQEFESILKNETILNYARIVIRQEVESIMKNQMEDMKRQMDDMKKQLEESASNI